MTTPLLVLPEISASQNQKETTHNQAIERLDALVHLSVLDRDLATPPGSPAEGDRYLVAASPTGAWAGKAGQIAYHRAGGWIFLVPREGWYCDVGDEDVLLRHDGTAWSVFAGGSTLIESLIVPVSDETTDLTTGTAKITFRMPYAFTLTAVRASATTAPTGAALTVDINEAGASILSTKLTIDAGEKTSTTAATAAVISDAALADDAEMTIDIDTIGSTVAGAGLKVTLIGFRA